MTTATIGPGFLLQVDDGGGVNFTTVANVHDINGPGEKTDTHEITNQSSSGGFKEWAAALQDGGSVTFDINWLATNPTHGPASGLLQLKRNRTTRTWRVIWPDDGLEHVRFTGFVDGFAPKLPVNGAAIAAVSIKVTGAPTWT